MHNKIKKVKTGSSVHGRKSKRVGLIIEENLLSELDKISRAAGVSRNSVILHAVRSFYKIKEKQE